MSEARTVVGGESLRDAFDELMSASSSLHMDDELVEGWVHGGRGEIPFLDEKYVWGRHCRKHLSAGLHIVGELCNKAEHLLDKELCLTLREERLIQREKELMQRVTDLEAKQI